MRQIFNYKRRKISTYAAVALITGASSMLLVGCGDGANAQTIRKHGANNAITDVDGILVGQYNQVGNGYQTGTTVVWAPEGSVGGVDVSGGWPGGVNTDALHPGKRGQKLDAVFLSGGSYYGLGVYPGVMRWLEDHGYGMQTGPEPDHLNPLVSGAIVYDLNRGGVWKARPDAEFGYKAIDAAKTGPVAQGTVGAGTGTGHGSPSVTDMRVKGGVGTASEVFDNITVGVIAIVNSIGTTIDDATCIVRGSEINIEDEFAYYIQPTQAECDAVKSNKTKAKSSKINTENHANTTIAAVATDATLTIEQANKLAAVVDDGIGLAIIPHNETGDGDSVFAMSTERREITDAQFEQLLEVASETAQRAVAHAVLHATSAAGMDSYCETFPNSCIPK